MIFAIFLKPRFLLEKDFAQDGNKYNLPKDFKRKG